MHHNSRRPAAFRGPRRDDFQRRAKPADAPKPDGAKPPACAAVRGGQVPDPIKVGFEVGEEHLALWERDFKYAFLIGGRGNGRSGTASRYVASRLLGREYMRGAIMRAVKEDTLPLPMSGMSSTREAPATRVEKHRSRRAPDRRSAARAEGSARFDIRRHPGRGVASAGGEAWP